MTYIPEIAVCDYDKLIATHAPRPHIVVDEEAVLREAEYARMREERKRTLDMWEAHDRILFDHW